jgi:hypothetical protein
MISARFGATVVVLMTVALIPTVLHNYLGVLHDDGRVTAAIDPVLSGLKSEPGTRLATTAKQIFNTDDWVERRYAGPGTDGLVLFAARSYDPKRLYHHPELVLLHGWDLQATGTRRLPHMPDMPVHVLRPTDEGRSGLAAYSLFYDERFVDNPYVFQLQSAWTLLFSGRRPMTLFWVHDLAFPPGGHIETAMAMRLLLEAVQSFVAQPRDST